MPDTIRVRVLVAVDATGDWHALGWPSDDGPLLRALALADFNGPVRYTWIEADVPKPVIVPEVTVEGQVAG